MKLSKWLQFPNPLLHRTFLFVCYFNQGTVGIPYVKGISESIHSALLPLNIKSIFQVCCPSLKTAFPRSGVVCLIQCEDRDPRGNGSQMLYPSQRAQTSLGTCYTCDEVKDGTGWPRLGDQTFCKCGTLAHEQRLASRKLLESWRTPGDPPAWNATCDVDLFK